MWTKPELRTSCSFRTHCDHRCFAAWLDDSNKNTLSFSINSVINIHCANFSVCAHTYHLKLLVLLKLNYVFRGNIKQHPKTNVCFFFKQYLQTTALSLSILADLYLILHFILVPAVYSNCIGSPASPWSPACARTVSRKSQEGNRTIRLKS